MLIYFQLECLNKHRRDIADDGELHDKRLYERYNNNKNDDDDDYEQTPTSPPAFVERYCCVILKDILCMNVLTYTDVDTHLKLILTSVHNVTFLRIS